MGTFYFWSTAKGSLHKLVQTIDWAVVNVCVCVWESEWVSEWVSEW